MQNFFRNKNILVFGLGKTGKSVVDYLKSCDSNVYTYDDSNTSGTRYQDIDMNNIDAVIVSPGIHYNWPDSHSLLRTARERLVPIYSDLDIFMNSKRDNQYVIAVTGTNGKSTTTALITHILKKAGISCDYGGNIGVPVLQMKRDLDVYVLEVSSYQLEISHSLDFSCAIMLNISPDHLDRHGGMPGYTAAKQRIFLNPNVFGIICIDDSYSYDMYEYLKNIRPDMLPISGRSTPFRGIGWKDNQLIDSPNNYYSTLFDASAKKNFTRAVKQNIAAAYAAVRRLNVSPEVFWEGVSSFHGLAHRQEIVEFNNVKFVNDSKATNAEATREALDAFRGQNVVWIVGGVPKSEGITPLRYYFPYVKKTFIIGENPNPFIDELAGYSYVVAGTMEKAVEMAYEEGQKFENPVILFSPAAASFDQFASFEERGDKFKELASKVTGAE